MFSNISDGVLGFLILLIVTPLLYLSARLAVRITYAWTVYRLRPLADLIGGSADRGYLKGHYRGHPVRVSFCPRYGLSRAYSNSYRRYINALDIELYQVVGHQEWSLKYVEPVKWINFNPLPVFLSLQTTDTQLAQRLEQAGVLTTVAALGGGSTSYETLRYSPGQQALFYTTDLTPKELPSREELVAQLQMLWQLAQLNQQVNPALPPAP